MLDDPQLLVIIICAVFFFMLVSIVINTGKKVDRELTSCEKIQCELEVKAVDILKIERDMEFSALEVREGIKHFEERYLVATGKPFPRVNAEIGKNIDVEG